jgi:protein-S-isoprenylcysteine O-methyltransferase Ste14
METRTPPVRELSRGQLVEVGLRCLAVGCFLTLISSLFRQWLQDPGRWSLIALLAIETITLGLIVCAREARFRDLSIPAAVTTALATFYFVLLDFSPGRHLIPEGAAVALQLAGMAWQLWAKWTLGRSFGLLPADRGLVTSGPYRVVRHPIYLGYLISHLGFLGANFSAHNALVLLGLYALQMARIHYEEKLLAGVVPAYAPYSQQVRSRFIPWVY